MEREIKGLERQENKLKGDIKKMAKQGQMDSAKVMAKDLVRTRGYIKKMHKMNSHMSAVRAPPKPARTLLRAPRSGCAALRALFTPHRSRAGLLQVSMRLATMQSSAGMVKVMAHTAVALAGSRGGSRGSRDCQGLGRSCVLSRRVRRRR